MTRKPYPTDLTDEQWERLRPLLPSPKSGTRKGGRPAADIQIAMIDLMLPRLRPTK